MENPTWNPDTEELEDETATYDDLKAEILEQAEANGIPWEWLRFCYDK